MSGTERPSPPSTGRLRAVRSAAVLCLLVGVVLVLHALLLGLHFEATPRALADAAKGRAIGYPAVVGALAAVVTLLAGRRRWAPVALAVAVLFCGWALVVEFTR